MALNSTAAFANKNLNLKSQTRINVYIMKRTPCDITHCAMSPMVWTSGEAFQVASGSNNCSTWHCIPRQCNNYGNSECCLVLLSLTLFWACTAIHLYSMRSIQAFHLSRVVNLHFPPLVDYSSIEGILH